MKILVTGGTGTISSGIVRAAVEAGHTVYAYTRGKHAHRNVEGAISLVGDVWDAEDVARQVGDQVFDVVVECLVYNVEQLKLSLQNWAGRCKQYVFISTSGVYPRNPGGERVTEDTPSGKLQWSYSANKLACENHLRSYCEQTKLTYTIVRPTVTYGDYRVPFPVVSRKNQWTLFQRILDGKPILSCCDSGIRFSIIHIDDFSRAVAGLFGNPAAVNEAFHISSDGCEYDWDEVIRVCEKSLGVQATILHVPVECFKYTFAYMYDEFRWSKSSSMVLSDQKLKRAVPTFTASVSLEEGLRSTVANLKEEYENFNRKLDQRWNDSVDLTLWGAVKKHKLPAGEEAAAKAYLDGLDRERRSFLSKRYFRITAKAGLKKLLGK